MGKPKCATVLSRRRHLQLFTRQLQPGAHIKVWCTLAGSQGFWHHGIVSCGAATSPDDMRVIHFAYPETVSVKERTIVETSLAWFLEGGDKPAVEQATIEDDEAEFDLDTVVARARSQLGKAGYDLPTRNCEHFASWCRTGTTFSKQVSVVGNYAFMSAAAFGVVGLMLKAFAANEWVA